MHRSLSVAFSSLSHAVRRRVVPAIVFGALTAGPATADGWPVAHGNPANTSIQNVVTGPATAPLRVVESLGTFADGLSPIVSKDGNVFLGTQQGKVIALRADGTRWWEYQMEAGWVVRSAPAVNSRGELFVLASRVVKDHRGELTVTRIDSRLLGFAEGGALLFQASVPLRGRGGISTAPLNLVRGPANEEFVVFPLRYVSEDGYFNEVRLLAFSRFGVVEGDVRVGSRFGSIGNDPWWGVGFEVDFDRDPNALPPFQPPLLGAAVPQGEGLDASVVVVNDGIGSVARYRFGGRFAGGFTEIARWKQGSRDPAVSAPVVALNGAVLFNRPRDVLILQTDGTDQRRKISRYTEAAPAVLPNGRIITGRVEEAGGAAGPEQAGSLVSPSASRNYLYVAGEDSLATYGLEDLAPVANFAWQHGGRCQPAIGPLGHVYALTYDKLHIFPPSPSVATGTNIAPGGVAGAATEPGSSGAGAPATQQPGNFEFNPAILSQPGVVP
jgi:hypothetical protein